MANTVKDEPKEILKKPEVKENGLNGNSNGCIDGITKDTSNEKTTEDNLKTDKMVSFYFPKIKPDLTFIWALFFR